MGQANHSYGTMLETRHNPNRRPICQYLEEWERRYEIR